MIKKIFTRRFIKEGGTIPRWYGVAYEAEIARLNYQNKQLERRRKASEDLARSYAYRVSEMDNLIYPTWCKNWNPLKDWNHTMQIVEKAIMDGHKFSCARR